MSELLKTTIFDLLWALIEKVRADKSVIQVVRSYETDLQVIYQPDFIGYTARNIPGAVYEINDFLLSQELKSLPGFQECRYLFNQVFETSNMLYILGDYLIHRGGLIQALEGDEPQAQLERDIETIIDDLKTNVTDYRAYFWLKGIYLQEERFTIGNYVLRRPTPQDLLPLVTINSLGSEGDMGDKTPGAILEFQYVNSDKLTDMFYCFRKIDDQIDDFIQLLRLYKLGAPFISKTVIKPTKIFHQGMRSNGPGKEAAYKRLTLSGTDTENLESFCKQALEPFKNRPKFVDIALDRYTDALLHYGTLERKVADVMTALEALFSTEKDGTERFKQRASRVLSQITEISPINIYGKFSEFYKIRSNYAHGSPKKIDINAQHFEELLDWTRHSILLFMSLANKYTKNEFLQLVDWALIDKKHSSKLDGLLDNFTDRAQELHPALSEPI